MSRAAVHLDNSATSRERELLSLLVGLSQEVVQGAVLEDVLTKVARAACELSVADTCSVMILDDERRELLCRASFGLNSGEADKVGFRVGEGVAGWVAQHGQPLRIEDTHEDPRFKTLQQLPGNPRSLCCIPLLARDGVLGVLTAGSAEVGGFTGDDEQFFSFLAATVAKDVENAQLYRKAVTDPLTRVFNRQYLSERLPREMDRHRRYGHSLSIVIIDIDRFKLVNDNWGHLAGDAVLGEVARRFTTLIRDVDSLIRYGGEEFLLILPSTDLQGATHVAERLREEVAKYPVRLPGGEIRITSSAGVAQMTAQDADAAALIARADVALYQAKASGRDAVIASVTNNN